MIARVLADIPDYHATPGDAGQTAAEAGAGALVFYHPVPPLPSRLLDGLFAEEARARYLGKVSVARDGQVYTLPAGSDDVIETEGFR